MPVPSPDVPVHEWPLSGEGRAAARGLMSRLPLGARMVSSDEHKAWETLNGRVNGVVRDARFNEVSRVGEPWGQDVRQQRRLYVEGMAPAGWEPQVDAAKRFEAGIAQALQRADDRPTVIATHGMVMTVWLVSRGAVSQTDAGTFWLGLGFPDCISVEPDGSSWRRFS
jgi:2,3-bisphosphoglycerate-dependent phosphoglycerate mutase